MPHIRYEAASEQWNRDCNRQKHSRLSWLGFSTGNLLSLLWGYSTLTCCGWLTSWWIDWSRRKELKLGKRWDSKSKRLKSQFVRERKRHSFEKIGSKKINKSLLIITSVASLIWRLFHRWSKWIPWTEWTIDGYHSVKAYEDNAAYNWRRESEEIWSQRDSDK